MSSPENISPVNPLPPVVLALFAVIIGVEVIFQLGARGLAGGPSGIGWRPTAIRDYGVNSDLTLWMVQNGRYPVEYLMRFISYPFVHGSFTHALFAGAMALALGKFVGEVFSQWATLLVFLGSSVAGALIYGLFSGQQLMLVGAFPGVYGLIGGFTYLMWLRLGQLGEAQSRAFVLIGFLMAIQLVFALVSNLLGASGSNASWLADVGGFAFGFLVSFFLAPGGWAKIRARIRRL